MLQAQVDVGLNRGGHGTFGFLLWGLFFAPASESKDKVFSSKRVTLVFIRKAPSPYGSACCGLVCGSPCGSPM